MSPSATTKHPPRPGWIKARLAPLGQYRSTEDIVRRHGLNTVCWSARCPNIGECWGQRGTATLMLLGNVCTRRCGFCAVMSGKPPSYDEDEPRRVALAVKEMGIRFAVLTSVARDDLPDGGARIFAESIREIRRVCPGVGIEVLIPDLRGDDESLDVVFDAKPDVLNHNVETVRRLQKGIRPSARYERSLYVLRRAAAAGLAAKSGIMLGLGEEREEVEETIADIRAAGATILTIGQYLRPDEDHLPLVRYATPEEFASYGNYARNLGYRHVVSAPLARSSYHADEAGTTYRSRPS